MVLISSPYGAFTDAKDVVADIDLGGRTAIVTGGATGIGIETARALALAGENANISTQKDINNLFMRQK